MKYKLLAIVLLASLLRLMHLSSLPPSLNWDEVSIGYNAYSILKTGKDEWGITLPTIFRSYGDYKLPVYVYTAVITEFIFGLTSIAVRLPSALSGVGLVITTFFLTGELLKNLLSRSLLEKAQLISALLVAIEPWNLFLSRVAVEANLAVFLVSLGVMLLLKQKISWGFLFLGLSVWTYNSARVFVPLLLVLWLIVNRHFFPNLIKYKRVEFMISALFVVLFFVTMFIQLLMPQGQARFKWVSLLDASTINQINHARQSFSSPYFARIIHNKLTYGAGIFLTNYFSYLSPQFLYLKGGTHYQFNIPDRGLLYIINLPFFIAGLTIVLKNLRKTEAKMLIFWLLIAPIAGSFTKDSPHTLRAIVTLPVPMIISAFGLIKLIQKNKLLLYVYVFFLLTYFSHFVYTYAYAYTKQYSWAWQYGYKEVVDFVKQNPHYQTIITTKKYGEPHEFFLFYMQYEPELFLADDNLIRYSQSDWYWTDRFDKYWFLNDWQVSELVTERGLAVKLILPALLIIGPDNAPDGWNKIKTIYFLDGSKSFEIFEKT